MSARPDGAPYRFGFVMEQTLGHVTHYKNLRATIDADPAVEASWYPLAFSPRGTLETLPPLRGNWTLRSSWRAHRVLSHGGAEQHDALFYHTQVTTLLSTGLMRRVPSVISLDATPLNYDAVGAAYGHHAAPSRIEALKRALTMRSLRAARALVPWCDWARRSLIDDYGLEAARITVIPPGVNLDLWPRPTRRDTAGPTRILFVGADFARKGGDILLDAFARLHDDCELHLVTKAPLEPAPGVYVYRDVAPNSALLKRLYATADLFVLPTLADCFPLAIQEAMAAGLPVIASDVGAIGEAVHDGETGLLTPPADGRALAAALEALVTDASRRHAMGARARELAEQRFDSAVNARRILGIMSGLAREHGRLHDSKRSSSHPHMATKPPAVGADIAARVIDRDRDASGMRSTA